MEHISPEDRALLEARQARERLEAQLDELEAEVEEDARAAARERERQDLTARIAAAASAERELLDRRDLARLASLRSAYEAVLRPLLQRLYDLDAAVQDLDVYAHAFREIERVMSARGSHPPAWRPRPVDLGLTTAGSVHALYKLAQAHGLHAQAVLPRGA